MPTKTIEEKYPTLAKVEEQLTSWNQLVEEVTGTLPQNVSAALMSGREDLLMGAINFPRVHAKEQAAALYNLIRVLMKTNRALQEHCQMLSDMSRDTRMQLKGLDGKLLALADVAAFRNPTEED